MTSSVLLFICQVKFNEKKNCFAAAMGRSALWNVPLDPTEEIQDIHDLDATDVPGHSHPSGADNRGETSKNTHPDTTFKPRSKPRKPSYSDDERRKMLQPDVIVVKGEIAKQEVQLFFLVCIVGKN